MDAINARAIRNIGKAADIIESLPMVGAEEYANGNFRNEPIVDLHFAAGNQARYGWKDLSDDYAEWKRKNTLILGKVRGKAVGLAVSDRDMQRINELKAQHRQTMRLYRVRKGADQEEIGDTKAFRKAQAAHHRKEMKSLLASIFGGRKRSTLNDTDAGGGGSRLPMLVLTGRMREAFSSRRHRIDKVRDGAIIIFGNLPLYAINHHEGRGVPKRSPAAPNAEDVKAIADVMTRYLYKALGTGGDVPVSQTSVPGQARFSNPLAHRRSG